MRVKICGIRTEEELSVAIKSGADAVGFLVGQIHASTDFILPSTAARLSAQMPPYVTPVVVTHLSDADSIMDIITKTGIGTIQIHGSVSDKDIKKIRDFLPHTGKIILASYLVETLPDLSSYYQFINAVLLDCYNREPGFIGNDTVAKVYSWDLAAQFVSHCPLPVILAGGLDPRNVLDAIEKVKPYGVDAHSRLKTDDKDRKCQNKCVEFVRNAKDAFFDLLK